MIDSPIKIKCPCCEGDGFTIDIEIECCWSPIFTGECCGRGIQKQVQKGCEYCNCSGFIELTEINQTQNEHTKI
jgi:hypothetical protein